MPGSSITEIEKCPTGIAGFDEIAEGGLPKGRPTLIAGHAGSGKTVFALEFVLHGIERYHEPGVFVSFEESQEELTVNVASFGYDLARFQQDNRLRILHLDLSATEMVEAGEFDLDGLFLRLGAAIDATGARRIALDGVENLFAAFADLRTLRAEFRRLMNWIKEKGITAVVTTEQGATTLTRHGLEEYIADCVIALDNRVVEQLATRRLRIVKYRGSAHGIDECPFILGRQGFSVMPITSVGLGYQVSSERLSMGIESLDDMLSGGPYRGSSILVTGTAGSGKSTLAGHMADAACRRGERCLYVAFEESQHQIERNMESVGLDLAQWRTAGLLRFHAARPTSVGTETHLAAINDLVREFRPQVVVFDPVTAFSELDNERVKLMLIRAVDLFKSNGITSLFTALTFGGKAPEVTSVAISSLMDVWLLLRNLELAGERTRGLYVCKARGMAHSNQIREFQITGDGVRLVDVLLDNEGQIITGSARLLHHALNEREAQRRAANDTRRRTVLQSRRNALEAKIAALRAEHDEELNALEMDLESEKSDMSAVNQATRDLANRRGGVSGAME